MWIVEYPNYSGKLTEIGNQERLFHKMLQNQKQRNLNLMSRNGEDFKIEAFAQL